MILILFLIKKDIKDLWIIQDYLMKLSKKFKSVSTNIDIGYFIVNENEEIFDANNIGK